MSTTPSVVIPEREVYRRVNAAPPPPEDLDARKRQFMVAPFLDVILSRRHEAKYTGIAVFHAGTIESINEVQYREVRGAKNVSVAFPVPVVGNGRRLPKVIAESIATKYGDASGGVATIHHLRSITGCEEVEGDAFQMLTFPVVPTYRGAIHDRIAHLQALASQPVDQIESVIRALIKRLVQSEGKQGALFRKVREAVELLETRDLLPTYHALVDEFLVASELGLQRARAHCDALIAEMDEKARGGDGKPAPEEGDRKVFNLLGEDIPRVTSLVRQGQTEAVPTHVSKGQTRECPFCYRDIPLKAPKCGECGEWLEDPEATRKRVWAEAEAKKAGVVVPAEEPAPVVPGDDAPSFSMDAALTEADALAESSEGDKPEPSRPTRNRNRDKND